MRFATAADFEAWLAEHHATEDELWIEYPRKGTGVPSVTHSDAIDVALCFGWIDGLRRTSDEPGFYTQRFTPRRARSKWSQVNVARVEALVAAGRMRPAGLAEVERAKADGRWAAAYPPASKITVPDDLRTALDASPVAAERFEALDRQNRYAILYRLHDARRPETRAKRLAQFVAMLERGEKLY